MVLAEKNYIPRVLAAAVRVMIVVRSIVAIDGCYARIKEDSKIKQALNNLVNEYSLYSILY